MQDLWMDVHLVLEKVRIRLVRDKPDFFSLSRAQAVTLYQLAESKLSEPILGFWLSSSLSNLGRAKLDHWATDWL